MTTSLSQLLLCSLAVLCAASGPAAAASPAAASPAAASPDAAAPAAAAAVVAPPAVETASAAPADAAPRRQRTAPLRASLDYTAATVEPGQVRLGPTELDIGVLPGLQVGTDPVLDALGIRNLRGRVGVRHAQRAALAVDLGGHALDIGGLHARNLRVEGRASLWTRHLGLHAGVRLAHLAVSGAPDLTQSPGLVQSVMGDERLAVLQGAVELLDIAPELSLRTVSARAAAELRLSGTHAIVLQAGDAVGRALALDPSTRAALDVADGDSALITMLQADRSAAAWGSLGWQVTGPRLRLRAGLGLADVPLTWASPAFELSWILGRLSERREPVEPEALARSAAPRS